MVDEITRRKQNWVEFADPKSGVRRLLVISYSEGMPPRPMLWWELLREREDWSYNTYLKKCEDISYIPDNTIPFLSMITGTEIFAEAFGCRVHYPDNNNPFALPMISSVDEFYKIKKPRLEDTKLPLLIESAERLRERAGADALLSLPDNQTPMDIAALIWEKSDFYAALYEEPSAVLELASMIKELQFEFFDEWFRRFGKEHIAHFPDYYMPSGITISEDEVGAVSAQMYREFFEDELNEFSERYGGIGVHCCADSAHQWENFKRIKGLKILNLCRDRQDTLTSLDVFRDVCGQYPGCALSDYGRLPEPERVHIAQYVYTSTREQAKRAAEHFAEYGVVPG